MKEVEEELQELKGQYDMIGRQGDSLIVEKDMIDLEYFVDNDPFDPREKSPTLWVITLSILSVDSPCSRQWSVPLEILIIERIFFFATAVISDELLLQGGV